MRNRGSETKLRTTGNERVSRSHFHNVSREEIVAQLTSNHRVRVEMQQRRTRKFRKNEMKSCEKTMQLRHWLNSDERNNQF
jgi:hypothetical protein